MTPAVSGIVCGVLGLAVGGLVMRLIARAREAVTAERLKAAEQTATDLKAVQDERNRLQAEVARLREVERVAQTHQSSLDDARAEVVQLKVALAEAQERHRSDEEKLAAYAEAEKRLAETFKALAGDTLKSTQTQFLETADQHLKGVVTKMQGGLGEHRAEIDKLVKPVTEKLDALDRGVRELEVKREGAYQQIGEQIQQLFLSHTRLNDTTNTLNQALRSSTVRGAWGEVQLRRVVEMAGMVEHVDFVEQEMAGTGKPDMQIRLPQGGVVPVDAKAPMHSYLEANAATDEEARQRLLDAHAASVRGHIAALAQKQYWEQFERSPEFVVMFLPNDASLSAAIQHKPDLNEYALANRVILASPFTLFALLKAVAFGWQQMQVAENAHQVAGLGRELYKRLGVFTEHLTNMGAGLNRATKAYNSAVGSLESMVLPQARRFRDLQGVTTDIPEIEPVEVQPRTLSAPEAKMLPLPLDQDIDGRQTVVAEHHSGA